MNRLAIAFIFALVCHMALGDQTPKICDTGKYWDGKACAACPTNCTECVLKNNVASCINCGSSTSKFLKLENDIGTCVSCTNNCTECRGPSFTDCFKPETGFTVNPSGVVKCDKPGCMYCKADTTCEKCQFGYRLDNGTCIKCSENCALCPASVSTCTKCSYGSMLNNASCTKCSEGCSNCPCTACEKGYQFSNNTCTKCSDLNCMTCDAKVDQCTACAASYWPNNGACTKCADNCAICTSDKQCTSCDIGYSPIDGVCKKCPDNCLECNGNGECTKCRSNTFKSDSKTCTPCSTKCAVCSDATTCTTCETDSLPNDKGGCKAFQECVRGQQLDNKGVCTDGSIDNCVYGNNVTASCFQCADGYYPSGNTCATCPSGCKKCLLNSKGYVQCQQVAQRGFSVVTTNDKSDKTGYLGVDNVYTVNSNSAASQCMPNSFLGIPSKEPTHTVCISDMEKCTSPYFTGTSWQCKLGAMNLVAITVSLFTVVFAFLFTL